MKNDDTAKLLRECSAGIKMASDSIDEILPYVDDNELKNILSTSRDEHEQLNSEAKRQLRSNGVEDKAPNPVAEGMSWIKINAKMAWNPGSAEVADLMTDGCGMGIKSLSKYLNKYPAADSDAIELARKTVRAEDDLVMKLRAYL